MLKQVVVGGHCIAVDPWFLIITEASEITPLIQTARKLIFLRQNGF